MQTLILPGYSLQNKTEAETIHRELGPEIDTVIWYWPYWESGQTETGWLEIEAEKIITSLKQQPTDIIAKSIGTAVAMILLKRIPYQIKKLILCGIPLADFLPGNDQYYEALRTKKTEEILCIQNENDNHGSFANVRNFIDTINTDIKVVSKPRSDHTYSYPEDFLTFLKA